jgi:hypothetical protein
LIEIIDDTSGGQQSSRDALEQSRTYCRQLERGEILCFPDRMFLASDDVRVLLTIGSADSLAHKNISYSPASGKIAGLRGIDSIEAIRASLKKYSEAAMAFCASLLGPYASAWLVEICSFRPMEERGRPLSAKERNDLLHIDAFPSRPSNGARILRMFTNINPERPRAWLTSPPLPLLSHEAYFAAMLAAAIRKAESLAQRTAANLIRAARGAGLDLPARSAYDRVMLQLHDEMKRSARFQADCPKYRHEFKPGSSWLAFTDTLPHAVLEGQFALEQSFFIPRHVLISPEVAPLSIIESAAGHSMTHEASIISN